jgi:tRNA 5-methylaminomethyl-2-thiouridine biosynthesis bifunctional protein
VPGAAAHPNIQLLKHHDVLELRKVDGSGRPGTANGAGQRAGGGAGRRCRDQTLPACAELPLKRIRGQITRLPQTAASQALRTVVCAEGYVAPARLGEHTLGASFDFNSDDLTPTTAEHQGNLALLEEISTDLARLQIDTGPETLQGRAAFRCTSPDYLPIVGPWPTARHSPRPMPR